MAQTGNATARSSMASRTASGVCRRTAAHRSGSYRSIRASWSTAHGCCPAELPSCSASRLAPTSLDNRRPGIRARVLAQTLQTGQRHEIARGGDARILPTGHLIYALGTVIYAVPIDLTTLEVKSAPAPVIEGVQRGVRGSGGQGGSANYDVSSNGTLVYVPDFATLAAGVPRRLLAVDFSGNSVPLIDDERDFWRPRISPDGTRVVVEVVISPNFASQVWIVDLERRTLNPAGGERDTGYPVWTPDGKSVIYRHGEGGLYRQPADGSEGAQLVDSPGSSFRVMDVSRHGVVAVAKGSPQDDIQTFHLGTGVMSDFLATPAREYMASFSPDGRWLAYTSNESGRDEVYVRPFPRTEGVARLVSIGGGSGPVWAPNGSTLYYRGADGDMMAVPVTLEPTFTSGRPQHAVPVCRRLSHVGNRDGVRHPSRWQALHHGLRARGPHRDSASAGQHRAQLVRGAASARAHVALIVALFGRGSSNALKRRHALPPLGRDQGAIRRGGPQWAGYAGLDGPGQSWRTIRRSS